jgi:hypothetical protein
MGSSFPLHRTLPPVGKLPESPKLPGLPKLLSDLHAALPFFCSSMLQGAGLYNLGNIGDFGNIGNF